jgi:hypothetical protein
VKIEHTRDGAQVFVRAFHKLLGGARNLGFCPKNNDVGKHRAPMEIQRTRAGKTR